MYSIHVLTSMLSLHTREGYSTVLVQFCGIVCSHLPTIVVPGETEWRVTSHLHPQIHLLPLRRMSITRKLYYTRLCIGHNNSTKILKVVFLTVDFLNGGFTVLSVALLEGCLIRGRARGRGMAWGGAVLGLVAMKFPVHKATHYYMNT